MTSAAIDVYVGVNAKLNEALLSLIGVLGAAFLLDVFAGRMTWTFIGLSSLCALSVVPATCAQISTGTPPVAVAAVVSPRRSKLMYAVVAAMLLMMVALIGSGAHWLRVEKSLFKASADAVLVGCLLYRLLRCRHQTASMMALWRGGAQFSEQDGRTSGT